MNLKQIIRCLQDKKADNKSKKTSLIALRAIICNSEMDRTSILKSQVEEVTKRLLEEKIAGRLTDERELKKHIHQIISDLS